MARNTMAARNTAKPRIRTAVGTNSSTVGRQASTSVAASGAAGRAAAGADANRLLTLRWEKVSSPVILERAHRDMAADPPSLEVHTAQRIGDPMHRISMKLDSTGATTKIL